MDGEAGWWTTSGNIGLPPLARVMGVSRQQQVEVSVACECMGGTRGSGVVSSAEDVLEMSVVLGVTDVGGVFKMCMCFTQGRV